MYALINIGMSILIGTIFILAAIVLQKNPPTDINAAYGYRTKRSMKIRNYGMRVTGIVQK